MSKNQALGEPITALSAKNCLLVMQTVTIKRISKKFQVRPKLLEEEKISWHCPF
jgi:hypothetical protein